MEHRHGVRLALDLPVRVSCAHALGVGRLRDVSLSGAYLHTRAMLPPLSCVRVEIEAAASTAGDRYRRLAAYVVRSDAQGYGLEWSDLRPEELDRLLESATATRSQADTIETAPLVPVPEKVARA